MHDRAVRRRRAVLVVLVAASLILLTAYFGESAGGGLHSVQRGVLDVVSPIQEGASRVLKPFRDLFGWFGDTIDAKDQRDKAEAERDTLVSENAILRNRLRMAEQQGQHCATASNRSVVHTGVKVSKGRSVKLKLAPRPPVAVVGAVGLVDGLELFEAPSAPDRDARERRLGAVGRHLGLLAQALVEAL